VPSGSRWLLISSSRMRCKPRFCQIKMSHALYTMQFATCQRICKNSGANDRVHAAAKSRTTCEARIRYHGTIITSHAAMNPNLCPPSGRWRGPAATRLQPLTACAVAQASLLLRGRGSCGAAAEAQEQADEDAGCCPHQKPAAERLTAARRGTAACLVEGGSRSSAPSILVGSRLTSAYGPHVRDPCANIRSRWAA